MMLSAVRCDVLLRGLSIRLLLTARIGGGALVAVVTACSHPTGTRSLSIDELLVGVDQLRDISHVKLDGAPKFTSDRPRHYDDPNTRAPCRAVFEDEYTFGSSWTQYRSVTYTGVTHSAPPDNAFIHVDIHGVAEIVQSVAIYPDPNTASTAFERLISSLKSCTELHASHYEFTMDSKDSSTVALNSQTLQLIYRIKSSAIIDVTAIGFHDTGGPPAGQIADAVSQAITHRIP